MKTILIATIASAAFVAPAMATEIGVGVGPVRAGVVAPDHDRTVVVKHRSPERKTTIIKKDEGGVRSKTIIHHGDDDD